MQANSTWHYISVACLAGLLHSAGDVPAAGGLTCDMRFAFAQKLEAPDCPVSLIFHNYKTEDEAIKGADMAHDLLHQSPEIFAEVRKSKNSSGHNSRSIFGNWQNKSRANFQNRRDSTPAKSKSRACYRKNNPRC